MKKYKKVLLGISLAVISLLAGAAGFRHIAVPVLPEEMPVKISAAFVDGTCTATVYTFTEEKDMKAIVELVDGMQYHRKLIFEKAYGFPFVFDYITLEYADRTVQMNPCGAGQLYIGDGQDKGTLCIADAAGYAAFIGGMRELCGA